MYLKYHYYDVYIQHTCVCLNICIRKPIKPYTNTLHCCVWMEFNVYCTCMYAWSVLNSLILLLLDTDVIKR